MKETEVKIDPLSLKFSVRKDDWTIRVPKSQTKLKYIEQLKLITKETDYFVPLAVSEEDDAYIFSYLIKAGLRKWATVKKLNRNEKLRALCNVGKLYTLLPSRITFFVHPNNIVFDENLMPKVIYRGIRGLIKPFDLSEAELLKQYKCFTIAMLSKEYTFDELYNGSLPNALNSSFAREVNEKGTINELVSYLKDSFHKEQRIAERNMQLVPRTRYSIYKQMTIWITVISVLVVSLLFYLTFVKVPYQDKLLFAHEKFLASDYSEVIQELSSEDVEELPYQSKYILAYSYIKVEQLSEKEKEVIMKNINLKSDKYYLLYWIYNGMGDFEQSIDIAKYMDDPQLIIYGLIKKLEAVRSDPSITGAERDEEVRSLRDELEEYNEEYDLIEESADDESDVEESEKPEESDKEEDSDSDVKKDQANEKEKEKKKKDT